MLINWRFGRNDLTPENVKMSDTSQEGGPWLEQQIQYSNDYFKNFTRPVPFQMFCGNVQSRSGPRGPLREMSLSLVQAAGATQFLSSKSPESRGRGSPYPGYHKRKDIVRKFPVTCYFPLRTDRALQVVPQRRLAWPWPESRVETAKSSKFIPAPPNETTMAKVIQTIPGECDGNCYKRAWRWAEILVPSYLWRCQCYILARQR